MDKKMIFSIDPSTNKKIIIASEGSIEHAILKSPNNFLKDFFEELNFNINESQNNIVSGSLNNIIFVIAFIDSQNISIVLTGGSGKKQISKGCKFKPDDNNKVNVLSSLTDDIRSMWSDLSLKPTKSSNDISF